MAATYGFLGLMAFLSVFSVHLDGARRNQFLDRHHQGQTPAGRSLCTNVGNFFTLVNCRSSSGTRRRSRSLDRAHARGLLARRLRLRDVPLAKTVARLRAMLPHPYDPLRPLMIPLFVIMGKAVLINTHLASSCDDRLGLRHLLLPAEHQGLPLRAPRRGQGRRAQGVARSSSSSTYRSCVDLCGRLRHVFMTAGKLSLAADRAPDQRNQDDQLGHLVARLRLLPPITACSCRDDSRDTDRR